MQSAALMGDLRPPYFATAASQFVVGLVEIRLGKDAQPYALTSGRTGRTSKDKAVMTGFLDAAQI